MCHNLKEVVSDTILRRAVAEIESKIEVFDKLRDAMHITVNEQSQGLNDDGEGADIVRVLSVDELVRGSGLKFPGHQTDIPLFGSKTVVEDSESLGITTENCGSEFLSGILIGDTCRAPEFLDIE